MSSASAIADPIRTQLRLAVLGQWVKAGLDLARGATAARGLIGGAVALWQVFQAVRLAMVLIQRLSERRGALARAALEHGSGETQDPGSAPCSDDVSGAAWLRHALIELNATIRDALGLGSDRRARPSPVWATAAAREIDVGRPLGRPTPPRERPPDRPPKPARRRSPRALHAGPTALPPIAPPASGRFRLGAR